MKVKNIPSILFLTLLLGLAIAIYGAIGDPFSIPFQDYEQLPKDVQLAYENESKNMKVFQYVGFSLLFISFFLLIFLSIFQKK
jgi:hypothetical protein